MNAFNNIIGTIRDGFRRTPPPFFREFISNYGDMPIKSITICKKPIKKTFDTILNVVSLGSWGRAKEGLNYDDLFHLFMILEMVDSSKILLEKNQVLNIELLNNYSPDKETLCLPVENYIPFSVTINMMLDKAVEEYGEDRIFLYSGVTNNCQRFLTDILVASGVINPTKQYEALEPDASGFIPTSYFGVIGQKNQDDKVYEFINQDTITLFNQMPQFVNKIAQGVTDIAGIFDRVLYGTGQNKTDIQSVLFDKDLWTIGKARRWLLSKDLQPIKKVHETDYYYRYRIIDPELFENVITKEVGYGIKLVIGFY